LLPFEGEFNPDVNKYESIDESIIANKGSCIMHEMHISFAHCAVVKWTLMCYYHYYKYYIIQYYVFMIKISVQCIINLFLLI